MAVKIARILIVGSVLLFLVFYGFDMLIKRLESKKHDKKARHKILQQQILENAKANIKVMKWAKTELSPDKINILEREHGKNIEVATIHHKVDQKLIKAIVYVESGGNKNAISPANAIGLMGVKPIAARDVMADSKYLRDPFYNLLIGSKYFGSLKTKYRFHNLEDQLLAYNRGPDAARAMLEANHNPAQDAYVQKIFLAREKMR